MATDNPDPTPQAGRGAGGACPRPTDDAQKKAAAGRLVLTYLDECGFSPSQPVNYSWAKLGQRKRIPYENPERRRVNLLAALDKAGPAPGLYWVTKPKSFLAEEFVRFLFALPPLTVPRVVVIDNGSLHRNAVLKAALAELWAKRIYPYYLPPYSPELNDIEPVFRNVKHHELPERRYASVSDLDAAINNALTRTEDRLVTKHQPQLRLAA